MNDNLLLENYEQFFTENKEYTENPQSASTLITDTTAYESYVESLLEGYSDEVRKSVRPLMDRQREMLLESSSTMLGSANAIAYATSAFPLILDLYSDDMLTKAITTGPSAVPTKTVNRLRWSGQVTEIDGTVKKYIMPNTKDIVRPGFVTIPLDKTSNNLFTKAGIPAGKHDDYRLIMRNFRAVEATVTTGANGDKNVILASSVDARGNLVAEGTLVVTAGVDECEYKISAQVNPETGEMTHSFNVINVVGVDTYVLKELKIKARIFGDGTAMSTVIATPKSNAIDFVMDVTDSVQIPLTAETLQDWNSVYKVDVMAQLKSVVKTQFALNKNFDIIDVIEGSLVDIKKAGAHKSVDLDVINANVDGASITDFYKSVIPALIALNETIRGNNGRRANVLIASTSVAVILKSLQTLDVSFDSDEKFGSIAASSVVGEFNRFTILSSPALTNDRVVLVVKGGTESEAGILELTYQPLYIIEEVTNGKTTINIRCRNDIHVVKTESIGVLDVKNVDKWLPVLTEV